MTDHQTREQIEARIAELTAENAKATSWGAAVGARSEEIEGLLKQLRATNPLAQVDRHNRSADSRDAQPCPFCGVLPLKTRAAETFIIHCGNADCDVTCEINGASPELVISAWNSRTGDDAQGSLDIPPERHRTDEQRADIQRAWDLIGSNDEIILNSTDGHLAVLRAIQLGRNLASQPSPAATVDIERLRAESLERQEQICKTNDRLMAAQDRAHSSAGNADAGCGAAVITPWADQYNACWDRSKPDALKSAAEKALNYIENTENELGTKLSCGDALREALK